MVEQNLPGAPLIHVLSQLIFGSHSWSFPVFDYLMLLGFVSILGYTLAVRQGKLVAAIFVPLYQLVYVTTGNDSNGQRDVIASHLGLVAGCFLLKRVDGGSRIGWLWRVSRSSSPRSSKPTFAVYAGALLVIDVVGGASRDARCGSLPRITLWPWLRWLLGPASYYYRVLDGLARGLLRGVDRLQCRLRIVGTIIVACGVIIGCRCRHPVLAGLHRNGPVGRLALVASRRPSHAHVLSISVLVSIASVLLQGRGFAYHTAAMLPALTAFMANALAWAASQVALWRRRKGGGGGGSLCRADAAGRLLGCRQEVCGDVPKARWVVDGYVGDDAYLKWSVPVGIPKSLRM